MARQKDNQPSSSSFLAYASSASPTFPSSFASCGVHILSSAVDQELLAHLLHHSATADSFYRLVEIFKHLQEHPLLSDSLLAKRSSKGDGDGNGKEDGQKKASSSSPSSIAIITTTITTDAASAIILKQFHSRLSLKIFILVPFVKSTLLLYLQQKRRAVQQQTQVVDSSSASIKGSHAEAFALMGSFLGLKLMPTLNDIHVVGEGEDDSDDEKEEEEDEEEMDEEDDWSASRRKNNNNEKDNSTETMAVTEEMDEQGAPVEVVGSGKEEGKKTRGGTAAPTSTAVKKKKTNRIFLEPQSLSDVWILSPIVQQHLIRTIW